MAAKGEQHDEEDFFIAILIQPESSAVTWCDFVILSLLMREGTKH